MKSGISLENASAHGPGATVKKFRKSHPHLNSGESTVRGLRAKYEELLKSETAGELASIPKLKRGSSFMLGELHEKVKNFLHVLRRKVGVVNTVETVAAAKAFIARSQNEHLNCIDLDSSYWAVFFDACGLQKKHAPPLSQKFHNWQKRKQS